LSSVRLLSVLVRRELVKGKLSQPGDIVVARDGTILVTDGMFTGGRLLRIRR
jgi:hypothetical protein